MIDYLAENKARVLTRRKLKNYMFNYLEIITVISSILLIRAGTLQQSGAEDDRMHQDILPLMKMLDFIPCKDAILRQGMTVSHDFVLLLALFLIDEIADPQIMKLLSVAIPSYNSEAYMRKCIESLLVGGEDVEILIVNDGSTDGTGTIADALFLIDEIADQHIQTGVACRDIPQNLQNFKISALLHPVIAGISYI